MKQAILAFGLGLTLAWAFMSFGHATGSSFPSVQDIESQLPLRPGQPLPKQVMNSRTGEIFNVIFLRGSYIGNGRYDAQLQLVGR